MPWLISDALRLASLLVYLSIPLQKNPLPPTLQIYLRSLKYGVLLGTPWKIIQSQVVDTICVRKRPLGASGGGSCTVLIITGQLNATIAFYEEG